MTDRVSLIVAAIVIGVVRVRFALPYAVHHGRITACNRGVQSLRAIAGKR
jgi:predicted transcriptional regulator